MADAQQIPQASANGVAAQLESEFALKVEEEDFDVDGQVAPGSAGVLSCLNGQLVAKYGFSSKPSRRAFPASPRRSPRLTTPGESPSVAASPATASKRKASARASGSSISPVKRSRKHSGYAAPSAYAHLKPLPDVLAPNLICVFIGLNPGVQTSIQGHAYAHPSNLFWKLLHSSGCTTRRCQPSEDQSLPRLFALGNTNIVSRPTKNGSELSKREMDDSVELLEEKAWKWKPEAVCIVGKSIWESIWRARHGKAIKEEEFKYGWQDESENMGRTEGNGHMKVMGKTEGDGHIKVESQDEDSPPLTSIDRADWKGAKVFVATSTSGLAASLSREEKERIWRELGSWVEQRRLERSGA